MEQELLFGEASPKILLLLHARVKGSDLFGCKRQTDENLGSRLDTVAEDLVQGHRCLADVALIAPAQRMNRSSCGILFEVLLPFH